MKYEYREGVPIEDCPFCANSWGPPQPEQHAAGRWSVGCMNPHCGASSGFCDTEDEAIAHWNKRPNADITSSVKNKEPKIGVEPDAWASKIMCIGPEYGKIRYGKLPIQSLNPLYYTHEKLFTEKSVLGLMKAAYYDGYTDREQELRDAA